jgi:uncharacterized protein YjiS (DUF1127 family)
MNATHRKVIGLADLGASGILGANMSGFAIEVAGEQAPVCLTQPTIEQLTIRRRGAGLRGYDPDRAWRSAFTQSSVRHRRVPRGSAPLGVTLGQAWRQLRRWIVRSRQRHALAELDDRLLRDIGVIRERDIGISREQARREIELFWRT